MADSTDDKKIKVFIVDSSGVWRQIMAKQILDEPDIEVVGEIGSGQGAILLIEDTDPDIVLLETGPDDKTPLLEIARQLHSVKPSIQIIMCVDSAQKEHVTVAADAGFGIADFITKPYKKQAALRAIRECYERVRE
jgi:DNA-binding NarL/FixJ family response regulator